jgi:hypothetical protein
MNFSSNQNRI